MWCGKENRSSIAGYTYIYRELKNGKKWKFFDEIHIIGLAHCVVCATWWWSSSSACLPHQNVFCLTKKYMNRLFGALQMLQLLAVMCSFCFLFRAFIAHWFKPHAKLRIMILKKQNFLCNFLLIFNNFVTVFGIIFGPILGYIISVCNACIVLFPFLTWNITEKHF